MGTLLDILLLLSASCLAENTKEKGEKKKGVKEQTTHLAETEARNLPRGDIVTTIRGVITGLACQRGLLVC